VDITNFDRIVSLRMIVDRGKIRVDREEVVGGRRIARGDGAAIKGVVCMIAIRHHIEMSST
jgi:hypothetical protein